MNPFLADDSALDTFLRNELTVSHVALESICDRLRTGMQRTHPRRPSAIWLAAAAALIGTATILSWPQPSLPADRGPGADATQTRSAATKVAAGDKHAAYASIPLRHDPDLGMSSDYDDPRRLGNLLRAADLIVIGHVIGPNDVTTGVTTSPADRTPGEPAAGDANFQIESVLLGSLPDPATPLTLRDHDGPTWFACAETLDLRAGERTALFLVADADQPGRFEVLFGDAGNNPLPMDGWFDVLDLRRIIATGTVSPDRVLQWLERDGFRIVTALPWEFYDLDGLTLPLAHPTVQDALVARLERTELSSIDTGDLILIVEQLQAGTFDRMPEVLRQGLRDQLPRVLDGVNGPFRAADLLRPFARRKEPWAYPQILGLLGSLVGAAQHLDRLQLLYALDPEDAIRRAWDAAEHLPESGYNNRARALDLLIEWDPVRAEAAIIDAARAQWNRGDRVWLDLVVRCRSHEARALAREILRSADYDPGLRYAIWRPELHHVIEEHDVDVRDLRETFAARLAVPTPDIEEFIDRLRSVFAAGGDTPRSERLGRHIARRSDMKRHELRALIRAIERVYGVQILRRPVATQAEMERWLEEWWGP